MGRYITILLLKICGWSILLTIAATFVVSAARPHHQHSCDMSGIVYGFAIFVPALLSIATVPAYLNLYKTIRVHFWYRWLSFYLLPISTMTAIALALFESAEDTLSVTLMGIPFFGLLIWAYFRFTRYSIHKINLCD